LLWRVMPPCTPTRRIRVEKIENLRISAAHSFARVGL
jgi:hypothetical protein